MWEKKFEYFVYKFLFCYIIICDWLNLCKRKRMKWFFREKLLFIRFLLNFLLNVDFNCEKKIVSRNKICIEYGEFIYSLI